MKMESVTFVRIYLTEEDPRAREIVSRLHDEETVRGVTVFRGISGFGSSGKVHTASLVDLSLDLPLVIEFFDTPERVSGIIAHLNGILEPGHLVTWSGQVFI